MGNGMNAWSLSIQIGHAQPYDVALHSERLTIGRTSEADIVISSNLVSHGVHGEFTYSNDHWYYEDKHSTNGTFVNGKLFWSGSNNLGQRVLLEDQATLDIDSDHRGEARSGVRIRLQKGECCSYQAIRLVKSKCLIGRAGSCDVVIQNIRVSRQNAIIYEINGKYELEPIAGATAVFVNNQAIVGKTTLLPRDVINIGGNLMMFAPGYLYLKSSAVGRGGVVLQAREIVRKNKGKLNKVSFDIHKGELVAIIGTSGAGKSTLLNALCGAVKPSSGTVLYNGQDLLANYDVIKNQTGFVPQKDIMQQGLTLGDMLQYAAQLRLQDDISTAERNARVDYVMNELSIAYAKNTPLDKVSGGQRKRASIAIEMLSDPDLFFLDEPTSGLDPGTENHLMKTLSELTNKGKTIILVTHTPLTLPICDKVIVMGNDGNMAYFGSPQGATQYFGVESFVDIFDLIDSADKAELWASKFNKQRTDLSQTLNIPQNKIRKYRYSRLKQSRILTMRYLHIVTRRKLWMLCSLVFAVGLPGIVGIVSNEQTYVTYNDTYKTLFTMAIAPILLGMLTACPEIVNERVILYRECAANLHFSAYLVSKLLVMFLINLVQSLLYILGISIFVGIPEVSLLFSPGLEMSITVLFTMFSASCLGFLISSALQSINVVTIFTCVLLIPQIVFSGAVFELEGMTRTIAAFVHAFWGTNALAISVGMEHLDMKEVIIEKGVQSGMKFVADTPVKDYLASNVDNLVYCWSCLLILAAACCILSYIFLRLWNRKFRY